MKHPVYQAVSGFANARLTWLRVVDTECYSTFTALLKGVVAYLDGKLADEEQLVPLARAFWQDVVAHPNAHAALQNAAPEAVALLMQAIEEKQ